MGSCRGRNVNVGLALAVQYVFPCVSVESLVSSGLLLSSRRLWIEMRPCLEWSGHDCALPSQVDFIRTQSVLKPAFLRRPTLASGLWSEIRTLEHGSSSNCPECFPKGPSTRIKMPCNDSPWVYAPPPRHILQIPGPVPQVYDVRDLRRPLCVGSGIPLPPHLSTPLDPTSR